MQIYVRIRLYINAFCKEITEVIEIIEFQLFWYKHTHFKKFYQQLLHQPLEERNRSR